MALTDRGALGAFRPIPNNTRAPCSTQKAIAAHNSVYDTIRTKRLVEYRAPCDVDKLDKPKAVPKAGPAGAS